MTLLKDIQSGKFGKVQKLSHVPRIEPKRPELKPLKSWESLTEKEQDKVQFHLAQCNIGVRILDNNTKSLRNIGLLHDRNAIFNLLTAFGQLGKHYIGNADFEAESIRHEDFIFRYLSATDEEKKRTEKFLEHLQDRR